MATDLHPCGHETCECMVQGLDAFCSPHCAEAAAAPDDARNAVCECGHAACSARRGGDAGDGGSRQAR